MAKKHDHPVLPYDATGEPGKPGTKRGKAKGSSVKKHSKRKSWNQTPGMVIQSGLKTGRFDPVDSSLVWRTSGGKWKQGHTVKGPRASRG